MLLKINLEKYLKIQVDLPLEAENQTNHNEYRYHPRNGLFSAFG
jgi:hypothetical protein